MRKPYAGRLGYDLNTVEFAVEGWRPICHRFSQPAPDADVHSVGQANFDWIVNAVAEMAVKKALSEEKPGAGVALGIVSGRGKKRRRRPKLRPPAKKKAKA